MALISSKQIKPEVAVTKQNVESESEESEEEVIEVPTEIEVEEIVEREVVKEEVVERHIPQAKAMYVYKGQGMKIDKGEVSYRNISK